MDVHCCEFHSHPNPQTSVDQLLTHSEDLIGFKFITLTAVKPAGNGELFRYFLTTTLNNNT